MRRQLSSFPSPASDVHSRPRQRGSRVPDGDRDPSEGPTGGNYRRITTFLARRVRAVSRLFVPARPRRCTSSPRAATAETKTHDLPPGGVEPPAQPRFGPCSRPRGSDRRRRRPSSVRTRIRAKYAGPFLKHIPYPCRCRPRRVGRHSRGGLDREETMHDREREHEKPSARTRPARLPQTIGDGRCRPMGLSVLGLGETPSSARPPARWWGALVEPQEGQTQWDAVRALERKVGRRFGRSITALLNGRSRERLLAVGGQHGT